MVYCEYHTLGLMISGSVVKIDESPMTGESDEIKKLPYQEMA